MSRLVRISVATVADLATVSCGDGDFVETAGYTTAGDGGGNVYIYRPSGKSGVTVDGGFYIDGRDSDDYYEAVDKSVANVRQFGGKPDAVYDSTAEVNAALSSAAAYSVACEFSGNTDGAESVFICSAEVSTNDGIHIYGKGGVTLQAANDNEFALTVSSTALGLTPFIIENLKFRGIASSRHGLQLAVGFMGQARDLTFFACGIGLLNNATIDCRYDRLWFQQCYVGAYVTTRTVVSGLGITDINGQTVTATASPYDGQSGEHLFDGCRFNACTFGYVQDSKGSVAGSGLSVLIDKPLVQSCSIGIWVTDEALATAGYNPLVINNGWFEANDTVSAYTVDGNSEVAPADIVMWSGKAIVSGGRLGSEAIARNFAEISIRECQIESDTLGIADTTASITGTTNYTDWKAPYVMRSNVIGTGNPNGRARFSATKTLPFSVGVSSDDIAAFGGSVRQSNPLFDKWSGWGQSVRTDVPGGQFGQCVNVAPWGPSGGIADLNTTLPSVDGELWLRTFSIRAVSDNIGSVDFNSSTDVFTLAIHQLATNDMVTLQGSDLPGGYTTTDSYYVTVIDPNTFTLSLTQLGEPVPGSTNGSGTTIHGNRRITHTGRMAGAFITQHEIDFSTNWTTFMYVGRANGSGNADAVWNVPADAVQFPEFQLAAQQLIVFERQPDLLEYCRNRYFADAPSLASASRKGDQETVTYAASLTIDFDSGSYDNKYVTLTGNPTITMSATRGGEYNLVLAQDVTGYRSVTWPVNVKWQGSPPGLNMEPSTTSVFKFYYSSDDGLFYGLS